MQDTKSSTSKSPLTIRKLAEAFNSSDHQEYRRVIDNAAIPAKMRQFLLRKEYYIRFQEDCAKFRENQLAVMEKSLSEQEAEVIASLEALEVSEKELETARKALLAAQHEFRLVEKKLQDQQAEYDKILEQHQKNQKSFQRGSAKQSEQEQLIKEAKKLLKEAQNYILIHSTATVSSIARKSGILVCSRYDENSLHFHKHVDQIIDIPKNRYADMIPENARSYFESDEEYHSAVAYVEMILKFFFDNCQYELLYNSEGIDKLLNIIM